MLTTIDHMGVSKVMGGGYPISSSIFWIFDKQTSYWWFTMEASISTEGLPSDDPWERYIYLIDHIKRLRKHSDGFYWYLSMNDLNMIIPSLLINIIIFIWYWLTYFLWSHAWYWCKSPQIILLWPLMVRSNFVASSSRARIIFSSLRRIWMRYAFFISWRRRDWLLGKASLETARSHGFSQQNLDMIGVQLAKFPETKARTWKLAAF